MTMVTDIVFPNNNEKEFINIAEKLNYSQIIFVYTNTIPKLNIQTKIKIIQKKEKNFAMEGDKARAYLENPNIKLVYALENKHEKDFIHQRASGLNHVLAKIAKQKNKTIAFSFSMILNSEKTERARILGRIMQNIKICRKYRVKTFIGSFTQTPMEMRSSNDLQAFFQAIGMSGSETKKAVEF